MSQTVTDHTLRKHIMGPFRVGQSMAFTAIWNLPVFGMAVRTTELAMLTGAALKKLIRLGMANPAMKQSDFTRHAGKRLMGLVAGAAVIFARVASRTISDL